MADDRFYLIALENVPEVVNKMIFYSKKCLSHILNATFGACDGIY